MEAEIVSVIQEIAKAKFQLDLKPFQIEIVQRSVQGFSSTAFMKTGSGKSVCYVLPALVLKKLRGVSKITVIISPLKALMNEQVIKLIIMISKMNFDIN